MATVRIMEITPDIAARMLAAGGNNWRAISEARRSRYAAEMAAGTWAFNGAPIVRNGSAVLDGWHRLMAVVDSGVTIQAVVVDGVDAAAVTTIDTQRSRNAGDYLRAVGETNYRLLSSALADLWRYQRRRGGARGGIEYPTVTEGVALLAQHPDLRQHVTPARAVAKLWRVSGGVVTVARYVSFGIDEADAEHFWARLEDGVGLTEGDPILAIRTRLSRDAAMPHRADRIYHHAWINKGWNLYRTGRSDVGTIYWRPGGVTREAFPYMM